MSKLLQIAKIIDKINQWIGRLTSWFILVMLLVGVWNVVGRYLGFAEKDSLASREATQLALIIVLSQGVPILL